MTDNNKSNIPDSLFEDRFDNGHGKFSLWDAMRSFLGIDTDGYIFRDGEWRYKQGCCKITGYWTGKWET